MVDGIDPRLITALEAQAAGRVDEAAATFRAVLAEHPSNFVALYSLALIELNRGHAELALGHVDLALQVNPGFASAHGLRGMALQALDRADEALLALTAAVECDPQQADLWINRGVLQHQLKQPWEALASFDAALRARPDMPGALANRGALLSELNRHQDAADCFQRLLEVAPDFDYGLGLLAFARRHCCDWRDSEAHRVAIEAGLRSGLRVCKTLALMAISDDVALQLQAARIFAQHRYPAPPFSQRWLPPRRAHERIRLAYLSPDFREHPVGHLTAGIFEKHDRARFEVVGVSIGIDDGGPLARRIRAGFDQFIDLRGRTAAVIAQTLRSMEIDILVDLAGYTADSRTDALALRCAPIQVNWLGYAGSMGTEYHDYILADRHVIPSAHRDYYSEKVVYLRDAYLPTDGSLEVADHTPTRTECGLPEQGFVFCSFNHDYKISAPVFAAWMRLLTAVPGSVLWLMKLHETAEANLRAAAAAAGVDPARLIFATRLPKVQDHLARYRVADLFLDTYPYNAHTTAADALYVGLPVLTLMGRTFPGRVAGSLLHALGVSDLACDSLEAYEARALELARDPAQLSTLRNKVAAHRRSHPLFDTERFVRSLESAFERIWKRHQQGLPTAHLAVDEAALVPAVAALQPARELQRLRIGAREKTPGWRTLDLQPGPGVDHTGSLSDLSQFASGSFDEIYAAHELVKVAQAAMVPTLRGLRRILRSDGRLLLSVPDLDVLCKLFLRPEGSKEERFRVMRMMYGAQTASGDFHLVGLNYEFLADYLAAAGFSRLQRVSAFGLFKDVSDATAFGQSVNLNVIALP